MSFVNRLQDMLFRKQPISEVKRSLDTRVEILIMKIMESKTFDLESSEIEMIHYFMENKEDNVKTLFDELASPLCGEYCQPRPDVLCRLLMVLHQVLRCREFQFQVAVNMCCTKIFWFDNQDKYNQQAERLLTEPSFSSYLPQVQSSQRPAPETPQDVSRIQKKNERLSKIQERRRERFQRNYTESGSTEPLQSQDFAALYYSYLLKLCANLELYVGVLKRSYPSKSKNLEHKVQFLWLYKLMNLMQTGLKLIEVFNVLNLRPQCIVYEDLHQCQDFLVQEVKYLLENYITLTLQDALSLYELFQECQKASEVIQNFKDQAKKLSQRQVYVDLEVPKIGLDSHTVQDFLNYSIRVRMLSQNRFRKQLKVPSRNDPYQVFAFTERQMTDEEEEEKKDEPERLLTEGQKNKQHKKAFSVLK